LGPVTDLRSSDGMVNKAVPYKHLNNYSSVKAWRNAEAEKQ
jgi:hypothetical protein